MSQNAPSRMLSPTRLSEDSVPLQETSCRPATLNDFIGQESIRRNLKVFIEASRQRGEAMDHVLFYGPPGLGKTTLAQIMSVELGVGFRTTSGPVIAKAGDLAAILTNLQPKDVLFIDETHRLNPAVEEILYPAMEDFKLDLMIGEGPSARSIRIDLPPFTLVAATTRKGLLTSPLRDRFGIHLRLEFYTPSEMVQIVEREFRLLGLTAEASAISEIASRARGTPRIAGRLVRRLRDFAIVAGLPHVTHSLADQALCQLGIDAHGLDRQDRRYLEKMASVYKGGPVGIETLAALLAEQKDTLEETIEPYLIQQGLVQKTPRGRVLTPGGYEYLTQAPQTL